MAKIIIKNSEISSSAGINIPGSLSVSGNVIIGDNFTDTLTVNSVATFNDDLTVVDTVSASVGRFTSITGSVFGNSTTATTLQTTRAINGTNFNGSAAITTDNWGTSRTITIGNTAKSVNGSAPYNWTLTEIGAAQTGSANTFTAVNTFNNYYITGSITGSDARFTTIVGGNSVVVGNGTTTSTSDVLIEARNNRAINNPLIVINDTNTSSSANTVFGRLAFRGYGGTQGNSSTRAEIRTAYSDASGATEIRLMTADANSAISTRLTVGNTGNITIGNGNLIIGTSGKGIDFSVTTPDGTSPSSELLDDYEEGTWTPAFSSAAGTWGYSAARLGRYVKVGNLVYASFSIVTNAANPDTSALSITGLPFTTETSSVSTCQIYWFGLASGLHTIYGVSLGNGTNIGLYYASSTIQSNSQTLPANATDASTTMYGSIVYRSV